MPFCPLSLLSRFPLGRRSLRISCTCTTGTTTSPRRRSSASSSNASAKSSKPFTRTTKSCWPSSRQAPRVTTSSCRRPQISRLFSQRHRPEALGRGDRTHQESEAVLGSVQRVVVHQGAHRRQHLARSRLFERYLPGELGRASRRPQIPYPARDAEG